MIGREYAIEIINEAQSLSKYELVIECSKLIGKIYNSVGCCGDCADYNKHECIVFDIDTGKTPFEYNDFCSEFVRRAE